MSKRVFWQKLLVNKEELTKNAEIFKVLGSPIRLEILLALEKNNCNVKKIYKSLRLRQSAVSQQLKILKMHRIVIGIKTGNRVCYRLSNNTAKQVIRLIGDNFFLKLIQ